MQPCLAAPHGGDRTHRYTALVPSDLRHALRADLATVVEIWVDAFARDPYLRWIQPDDARWPDFGTAG
jgi:hypothetical protein